MRITPLARLRPAPRAPDFLTGEERSMKALVRRIVIFLIVAGLAALIWPMLPSQSSSPTVKPSIFGGGAA
ncbi:hypothetical protein [Bradyrhizobium sp. SZCCHNRI1058]|uniref:hypothetical protein n=1 Tax=Bradyrhizobium sp. SZCCHNRI1058 TaxID=3057279 RepID=UPI0029164E86|nr:hypothetical protein [Bradyrhizobium sp. SZCCHNRI1058]